ncbi:MAG: hypothetical protein WKF51_09015 [Geodermatophilaceae bacterium]
MGSTRLWRSWGAIAIVAVDASSTSSQGSTATSDESAPVGVIALGHSGLTGEGSDPDRPGEDVPENSWATGTAPEVNSIYLRLVALRPETRDHVSNQGRGGAEAAALVSQAEAALRMVPTPELVIIETIDNDIRCDGTDAEHIVEFGAAVEAALDVITAASPDSGILLVGQMGRPDPAYIEQLVVEDPTVKAQLSGTGICDFFDPAGQLVEANFETLTGIIDGYEAEQARVVCAAVPRCRTDDGARRAYVDEFANLTPDWNHLNVQGNAREAEITWPSVAALLGL